MSDTTYPKPALLPLSPRFARPDADPTDLDRLRRTVKRLNRRCQAAESAVAEKVRTQRAAGGGLSYHLMRAAHDAIGRERDALWVVLNEARDAARIIGACPDNCPKCKTAAWEVYLAYDAAIQVASRDAAAGPAGHSVRSGVLQTGKGERKMSEYLSTTEACAIAAHEANRVYCAILNDNSQTAWNDAPQWQRDSAINGAKAVLTGSGGPRESHEGWLAEKEATGWVYGEVKAPDATPPTHPCMVPYDELPPEQKAKDVLFIAVVKAMAEACVE